MDGFYVGFLIGAIGGVALATCILYGMVKEARREADDYRRRIEQLIERLRKEQNDGH